MSNTVTFIKEANETKTAAAPNLGTRKLEFEASAFSHLRKVLTELYSNPAVAVLREVLANAEDSRNKSGLTHLPIEVELPSAENGWVLTVRDYGVGMSYDEIDNTYANYGASGKRNNTDTDGATKRKVIGGYGLGAKAALAIAKRFDVVSVKDGIETKFHMGAVDDTDLSDDFSITYDSMEPTTAPNGVEVKIPYPTKYKFSNVNNIVKGLNNIVINGVPSQENLHVESRYTALYSADGSVAGYYPNLNHNNIYEHERSLNVYLGGITYPVEVSAILELLPKDSMTEEEYDNYSTALTFLVATSSKTYPFYMVVPTTMMKPTPNREDLYYSAETALIMGKVAYEIYTLFQLDFVAAANRCDTPQQVLELINRWNGHGAVPRTANWRGEPIQRVFAGANNEVFVVSQPPRRQSWRLEHDKNPQNFVKRSASTLIVKHVQGLTLTENIRLMEKVQRRMRTFCTETGIEEIFFLPESVYNSKWWNFSPAYSETFVTTEDVYNEILKIARAIRANKPKAPVVAFPYKKIFVEAPDVKLSYTVNTVADEAESINKPVLYTTPNELLIQDTEYSTTGMSDKAFWNFYYENFSKDYVLVALNSRQRVETFLKKYPNALSLRKVVVQEIAKQGAHTQQVSWLAVKVGVGHIVKGTLEHICDLYKKLDSSEFNDKRLDTIVSFMESKPEEKEGISALYVKYVKSSPVHVQEQKQEYINLIIETVETYQGVASMVKEAKEWKKNKDILALLFNRYKEAPKTVAE